MRSERAMQRSLLKSLRVSSPEASQLISLEVLWKSIHGQAMSSSAITASMVTRGFMHTAGCWKMPASPM